MPILPIPLSAYPAVAAASLWEVLSSRASHAPFNLVATLIFIAAIVHMFFAPRFRHWAHLAEAQHAAKGPCEPAVSASDPDEEDDTWEVGYKGQILHLLGEVEAVFGLWAVGLAGAIVYFYGWAAVVDYIGKTVSFTDPMFVVVIMAIAGTRPVLHAAENCLRLFASLGRGSLAAWWLSILIVTPALGSLITEPAAMTIAALLLARLFYIHRPSPRLAYATLGLLFVNISVGGTLTHFAAPPILMVAGPWHWGTAYLFLHFGWKAMIGIIIATALYFAAFRRELITLDQVRRTRAQPGRNPTPMPRWITGAHLLFLGATVAVAHYPPLFIAVFLFFLAFHQATTHHQAKLDLRSPLLVGFFLAGLVVHGGLQAWWIEPLLTRLEQYPLFLGATLLTAFNDNAAITYLATLVPHFTDDLKYVLVAGAVTGGGLTVIANAPNPAGLNILQRFFPDGISPVGLALGAFIPTVIVGACFLLL